MAAELQAAVLAAKRENPRRSIRQILRQMEAAGTLARGTVSRSAIYRLLLQHGLSLVSQSTSLPEEHRRFVAEGKGKLERQPICRCECNTRLGNPCGGGRHALSNISARDVGKAVPSAIHAPRSEPHCGVLTCAGRHPSIHCRRATGPRLD